MCDIVTVHIFKVKVKNAKTEKTILKIKDFQRQTNDLYSEKYVFLDMKRK